ncbi:amidase family protein [Paenibacillus macquariensis]|uniref:Amidase n=1 Tax=Paenibacillus macquariensis TaxID=948756 RepID=A0ABY1KB12_9BACL|nr:amidase family protein [Paenibacillus macquariensis]MEC0089520.1 amidase family protein [Paenibacillus macquariensis]OAB25808.1 amidase [Paenibacillus macquariensis subsp. macquariensis]SIR53194.1 amidase [Paenibacillus macquariensis]
MYINLQGWIVEADIMSMQVAMESGAMSSEELVRIYVDRIHKYDADINSILEINPDAIQIARDLDKERQETGSRGKLHGIPMLLKDNLDTGDNMHTSAGSVALADSFAATDSFVASKLRLAGAVANMSEWSNFMSSRMPAGYSSRGGLVLNPYGPGEIFISGSSSGSAAAVASNFAAVAIGTETAGSIVGPACQSFLVGIKPTVGLVSRAGVIPISVSQDTPGPIVRTVTDAAIILGALTGIDDKDDATRSSEGCSYGDYTSFLDADYIRQARIGIPRHYYKHLDEERLAIMEAAILTLRNAGATIVDPVSLHIEHNDWNNDVICYEFKKGLDQYLSQLSDSVPVHSLQELIEYNENHAEVALKYGQDTLIRSAASTLTEQEYRQKKQEYDALALTKGIDYVLEQHGLDALMLPGDVDGMFIAARLGYPLITVPAGYSTTGVVDSDGDSTKGPFGVVFSGKAFSEPTLIQIAYGFEQATNYRYPPDVG